MLRIVGNPYRLNDKALLVMTICTVIGELTILCIEQRLQQVAVNTLHSKSNMDSLAGLLCNGDLMQFQ
jgi:hypothetical protein